MRHIIIGDAHGDLKRVISLLERISINQDDKVIFIGDLVDFDMEYQPDRNVKDLVEFIIQNKFTSIMGNHERVLFDWMIDGRQMSNFQLDIGGDATMMSYGIRQRPKFYRGLIPDSHYEFFRSLQPYYCTDEFILVHACLTHPHIAKQIVEQRTLSRNDYEEIIWARVQGVSPEVREIIGDRLLITGHTAKLEGTMISGPNVEDRYLNIDSYASLWAVVIEDKKWKLVETPYPREVYWNQAPVSTKVLSIDNVYPQERNYNED